MNNVTDFLTDDNRLQEAIERLTAEARAGRSGADEVAALKSLVTQLRDANQNLVLATVRAQVLQEEAEARNRQQNEFLAMLAHELRNPMAPISNAARLLEKINAAHPLLPEIQGAISRQVEHMARLLDDLLDASRIKSGKVKLHKCAVTLHDIINRSVEVSRPSVEKRRQELVIDVPGEPMLVDGDIIRLAQVVSNLLLNASRYTHECGHIALAVRQDGDNAVISVKDNGRGIEPELQPHIFELFIQGPRSLERSEGGLGIGLAVAQGLVQMHGGQLSVRSDGAGCGSEFLIMLPLLAQQPLQPGSEPPAQETVSPACRRILLIEDNADALGTLRVLLEMEGHHILTAGDGLSGLALAKEHDFDAIICDIGLPGIDGYEVIRQIRRQSNRPTTFAIALSGYGQPEDRARALEAGFDQYLVKPVRGDHLLTMISLGLAA